MPKRRKKKRKYKFKNIMKLIITIFIVAFIINLVLSDNKADKSKENNKVNKVQTTYINKISNHKDFNDKIDKKLQDKIIEYMDTYFKAMTTLKEIDMTNFFGDKAYEEAYINQTAISTLVNIRKLERNDMTISDAKYDIIYKKITKDKDKISVTFLENDYLHFNFMKDIESKVYDVENTIVFNDSYEILSIRKVQDFYVMITNKYETGKTNKEAKKELDEIKNNHIDDYKKQIKILKSEQSKYEEGKDKPSKKCDNKYNRKDALAYAKRYVINKNSDWENYADIGGNCQNYASQVLYAGGIPMDTVGDSTIQWKHYGSKLDETNNKNGRSSSWAGVKEFYNYAKNNNGYGLCSKVDINQFYAEYGDIAQVGYDENYRHSVVIIGNVKDKNGKTLDLLINSNSVNLANYPLSGYVYPYKRVIKIFGWNKE